MRSPLIAGLLLAAVLAPGAHAASWSTTELGATRANVPPVAAMSPNGGWAVAWTGADDQLQVRVHPAGGPSSTFAIAGAPRPLELAVNDAGDVVVLASELQFSATSLHFFTRAAGSQEVRDPGFQGSRAGNGSVHVAMLADGTAIALHATGGVIDLESALRGGTFASVPVDVGADGFVGAVDLATTPSGDVALAWTARHTDPDGDIEAQLHLARGGAPGGLSSLVVDSSGPVAAATGAGGDFARVALGADGSADLAWLWETDFDQVTRSYCIYIRALHVVPGVTGPDTAEAARQLDARCVDPDHPDSLRAPQLMRTADGGAVVAYARANAAPGGATALQRVAHFRAPGTSALAAAAMAPQDDVTVGLNNVLASPGGATLLGVGSHALVAQTSGDDGATFGAAQTLVASADTETLTAGRPGADGRDAVTGATLTNSNGATARMLTYDATPPQLTGVTIPGTAVAGSPVAMSASVSDALDDSPAITWDFGDGVVAAGASVTHVFAAAGAYTVTVRGTDAAQNIATQTQQVVIGATTSAPSDNAPVDKASLDKSLSRDATAPGLTSARLRPARVSRRRPLIAVHVIVSEPAALALTVQRCAHHRCRAAIAKTVTVAPGRVIAHLRLRRGSAPGRYRVTVVATDAAGNTSAPVVLPLVLT